MMRKIVYSLTKLAHYVLPNSILMNILYFTSRVPLIRRCINLFDPNDIRKNLNFDLPEKVIKLRDRRWNLFVDSRDHIGFRSYIKNKPFEMSIYQLCQKLKSQNRKVIVDIGANIGTASIPACAENDYELLAVEASKTNLPLLSKNILINKIRAKIFQCALVDIVVDDYVSLYINKGNTGANSLLKEWNPSVADKKLRTVEFVQSKTFDQVVCEARIRVDDIVVTKIDVEGFEEAVLKGSSKFLEDNSAPIVLEYRLDAVKKYVGTDMSEVLETLEQFNYQIYGLSEQGKLIEFVSTNSYENILALKTGTEPTKLILQSTY